MKIPATNVTTPPVLDPTTQNTPIGQTPPPAGGGNAGTQASHLPPAGGGAVQRSMISYSQDELDAMSQIRSANEASLGAAGFDYDQISSLLGKLMIEYAGNQRTNAMNQRSLGYQQAKAESLSQANELKEAADKMSKGADLSMGIGIAFAGVSMIMSSASLVKQFTGAAKSMKPGGAMDQVNKSQQELNSLKLEGNFEKMKYGKVSEGTKESIKTARTELKTNTEKLSEIDKGVQRFQTMAEIGQTLSNSAGQLGRGLDTKEQANAKRDEAEGSIHAAEATQAQQKADLAKEVQSAMDDMIKSILNMIKELKDSKVEMMRAITRS